MTTLLLACFASLYAAAMARPVSALGTGVLDGQVPKQPLQKDLDARLPSARHLIQRGPNAAF